MTRIFPFLGWFKNYTTTALRADLIGGLTVALVLIPQSMAYAQLAGLPAYYGLYAAFLPPMVASLFGSSRQLATGPVAVVSLMTAATLEPLATAGSIEYNAYAILLALLVGLFQLSLGILRLGMIVNFLSHPVVNGFTNAAALIIATSQLSKIFGVYVDKAHHHYETVYRVVLAAIHYTHWPTLGMAVLAFATMIGLRRLDRRIPNVLVAVVVATVLSRLVSFEKNHSIEINDLHSPHATELIAEFNTATAERGAMETLRFSQSDAEDDGAENSDQGHDIPVNICTGCHGLPEVSADGTTAVPLTHPPTEDAMLSLHHQAGLLDLEIEHLKHEISVVRSEIYSLHFQAMETDDGHLLFYDEGELPDGAAPTGGTWRIKIKQVALDPTNLTMIGGGAIVGTIPPGLPKLAVPILDLGLISKLFVMAMVISLIGFMEAISIAKAMAARTQQWLDPNQELIGQGLANIVGCFGSSYAVSGSFSRSAVNLQAGAVSGLSNVFSSAVVVLVLLFATASLYYLPQAVLAAVIMMAVIGLLNVDGFVHAWKAQRFDGITAVITFVATLGFAPHLEWGIAIGVLLSLGNYLVRTMQPHVAELSLHWDGSLRDSGRFGLAGCKHIATIRFDGPLNFANTAYLEDKVQERVAHMPELRTVLIAAHGINEIDASGEEALSRLTARLRENGYEVYFSGVKEGVMDVLKRTHLAKMIGDEAIFPTQMAAIQAIHAKAHVDSTEKECPLINVVKLDQQ